MLRPSRNHPRVLTRKGKVIPKRRVLVTGASKGIGRAVADRLAAGGYEVMGLARTAPSDSPGQFHEVDLADRAAAAVTLEKIVGDGTADAVVNNVGFARCGRIGSIDLDDLFATYDMNVRTAVQVVQARGCEVPRPAVTSSEPGEPAVRRTTTRRVVGPSGGRLR